MSGAKKRNMGGVRSFRDVLEKWNDYYINTDFGIGIQCDKCKKWRRVFQYQDKSEIPEVWTCDMWLIDKKRKGNCKMPSHLTEDDLVDAKYEPGSMVWAKVGRYDWWPGIVEDCPDTQEYFLFYGDAGEEYHVTFFGVTPSRNWISISRIRDFQDPPPADPKRKKKSVMLEKAIEQANEAALLSNKERLKRYSFLVRYRGRWKRVRNPAKVTLPPTCSDVKTSKKSKVSTSENTGKKSPKSEKNRTPLVSKKEDKTILKAATKRKYVEVGEESPPTTNQNELEEKDVDSGNPVDKPNVEERRHSSETSRVSLSKVKRRRRIKPESLDVEKNKNQECEAEVDGELQAKDTGNLYVQSNHSPVSIDSKDLPTIKSAETCSTSQPEASPALSFPIEESSSNLVSGESGTESLTDNEAKDEASSLLKSEFDLFLIQNNISDFSKSGSKKQKTHFLSENGSAGNQEDASTATSPESYSDESSDSLVQASCSVNKIEDPVKQEKVKKHWQIADAIFKSNTSKCLLHSGI